MKLWNTSALVENTVPKFTTNVRNADALGGGGVTSKYGGFVLTMRVNMCAANPYPDVRRRYWNAYMLFYQKISDQNSPVLPKKSRVSIMRQEAEDLSLSVDLSLLYSFVSK